MSTRRRKILAAYERALEAYAYPWPLGAGRAPEGYESVSDVLPFMEGPGDYYTAAEVEDALAWARRIRKADAKWRARQDDPQGRLL